MRGLDATQLLDPGSWCAIAAWSGLVLLAMALLMSLLDWGELSGVGPGGPPRRRLTRLFAVAGAALLVLAALAALVLG